MWIRPRERGDLCLEMDIEMGIERESNKSEKMGVERERERESAYVKVVERNNKKI